MTETKTTNITKLKTYMQGKEKVTIKEIKQAFPEMKYAPVILSQGVKEGRFEKLVKGYKLKE